MDSRIEKLQSCLAQFRQMPEASMLIEYRSRLNRLTFDDRMAVTRCIEKTFAPVFLDMRAESPSLSESDLIFCALAAAGLKPKVFAAGAGAASFAGSAGLNAPPNGFEVSAF